MNKELEVSFNSPQCGWMSIGFDDGADEFHTTTAHAPYENVLSELLRILTDLLDVGSREFEEILKWNRNPEEFDFVFRKDKQHTTLEIIEYPTKLRDRKNAETVFRHTGGAREICEAFYETFTQLYAERETDEFEQNWRQPFPVGEFEKFEQTVARK